MVIREKGLLKAMKEAYKQDGYKVARLGTEDGSWLMVQGGDWAVEIEAGNVPRKVLGLIAEHLGKLPEAGEAFQCRKDAPQTVIYDTVAHLAADLDLRAEQGRPEKAKETSLTWNGCNLWQRTGDQKIVLVDPEDQDILDIRGREVYALGNAIYVAGCASRAYIFQCGMSAGSDKYLEHLAQMQWTK